MSNGTVEKYVLFICGGRWQLPWLQFLKQKGHRIILADPYPDSVCVAHADVYLKFDARDCDGIEAAIKAAGYEIELVTSDQTDVATQTVAELSRRFGTPGNPPEVTELFSNKYLNREFVSREFGAHVPEYTRLRTVDELQQFLHKAGGDIIIKPPDAQSSRGIHRINAGTADPAPLLADALSQTPGDYIIAEQFITGTELTVEGICVNGAHHTLAISAKKHFRTGIASDLRYPAPLPAVFESELKAFHDEMVQRTGLRSGITHAEYLVDSQKGEFTLVEVACRGGGTLIPSDIVPWVSGVNVYEVFYSLLKCESPEIQPLAQSRHAILHFFEFPAGRVTAISGLEEARQIPGVRMAELEFGVGSVLKPAGDDRGRQGFTIVFADTAEELDERLDKLITTISVVTENVQTV